MKWLALTLLPMLAFGQGVMFPGPGAALSTTPAFAFRGKSINTGCASSTTCSVTISPSILASSALIVNAWTNNNVYVTGISPGGTCVSLPSVGGTASTIFHSRCWVQSSGATSGPITVTWNATNGGGVVEIREATTSGGTPILDVASAIYAPYSAVPIVGPSYTLAGASDWLVETENNDHALTTACASPWSTNTNFDATNGPGFCDHVATNSGTGASFTTTNSGTNNYVAAGIGLGFGVSACSYSSVEDHITGVNGASVSLSAENGSLYDTLNVGGFTAITTATGFLYSNTAGIALPASSRLCGTGTSKGTASSMGVTYLDSNNPLQNTTLLIDKTTVGWTYPTVSVGFMYDPGTCTSACGNGNSWTPARIEGFGGGDAGFHLISMVATLESDSGSSATAATLVGGTQYLISIGYSAAGGNHTLSVYDSTGTTLLGTVTRAATVGKGNPTDFQYGRLGEPGTTGGLEKFGNIMICWDGRLPCKP